MGQIADWWCRREALRLSIRSNLLQVINEGQQPIASVQVVVEDTGGETLIDVPPCSRARAPPSPCRSPGARPPKSIAT